jgi:gliding motility-associated-like protein
MRFVRNPYTRFLGIAFSILLSLGLVTFGPLPPSESIRAHSDFSVSELVKDIFAGGACDNITNVKAIGDAGGIGYFYNGDESIGLSTGIVLSTGPVEHIEGPNQATDFSGDFQDESGDPDLDLMVNQEVFDAVGIEFDFEPLDSFVTFRYVFASEEYCEFAGSIYNDVFGFFISGPGINGNFSNNAENVALVPGSQDYVSINNINHNTNEDYYIGNELASDAEQCNTYFNSTAFHQAIEFDGFTTELMATLKLTPCETYHIRLVVADVADAFYNSAVFLEAGSFNLGGRVDIRGVSMQSEGSDVIYEGCPQGYFEFSRAGNTHTLLPVNVNFKIAPQSTAQEGIDFAAFPTQRVTIPPGQTSVQLPVDVFNDNLTEPYETLILELDVPCACYTDTAMLRISDAPDYTIDLPDISVCESQFGEMAPILEGGVAPFSYQWSNNATTSVIEVPADGPAWYAVTITDACGTVATDSATVYITEPPTAELSGFADICEGDTAYLQVALTGTGPWHLTYAVDEVIANTFSDITTTPFQLPVTAGGMYTIAYFEDSACEGVATGEGFVEMNPMVVDADITDVRCYGESDGSITFSLSGGASPVAWVWDDGTANTYSRTQLAQGTYALSLTDSKGCEKVVPFVVEQPAPLQPLEINCEALAAGYFEAAPSGGTPPYRYAVEGSSLESEALFSTLLPGQTYNLTVADANDCYLEQSFFMPAVVENLVELPAELEVIFGETVTIQPALLVPQAQLANIRWITTADIDCIDCLTPTFRALQSEFLQLRLFDIFGCSHTYEITVNVTVEADYFIPNAFSPNGDQINDRLVVFANEYQVEEVLSMQVFDRWGGMCYSAGPFPPNDEQYGWDGTTNGKAMDTGVYVYFVRLRLVDGQEVIARGSAALIK